MGEVHFRITYGLIIPVAMMAITALMVFDVFSTGSETADGILKWSLFVVGWSVTIRQLWLARRDLQHHRRERKRITRTLLPCPGLLRCSDGSKVPLILIPTSEIGEYFALDPRSQGPIMPGVDDEVFARYEKTWEPVRIRPPEESN